MIIKNASQLRQYFELKNKLEYLKTLEKSSNIHKQEVKEAKNEKNKKC